MDIYLGSLVQLCFGIEEYCKQISLACVGSAHSVWATLGLPLLTVCVFSQSTLLRLHVALQELSKAGPALRALPRSKPLSFRFLGTPQRHRLGWACILCLVSTLSQVGGVSYHLPGPSCSVLGVQREHCLRCAMCLLWGADV